jgi:tripartite-type tricarboxylate transporter receptor subunit TctC
MRNKKIRLLISLILVLTLVFTACATKREAPAETTGENTEAKAAETKELWKPDKAVTLIVPSTAGGGHDNAARVWAKCAEKYAGVPINIVNQASGAGVVAFTETMNAKPDGLTLGQASISLVSDQYLVDGVTYNQDSFEYIGMDSADANSLVVSTSGPYKDMDLKEFIEYAKANPKKIRIGVSGSWTNHDYTRYLLEQTSGAEFTRVSIKGGANIVLGVLSGDLDAGVPYPSEIRAQVEAGKLKILGITGNDRSNFWPEVPTFKEHGYDINLSTWRAIIVPKETPADILAGWEDIYEKTMNDPETVKQFEDVGITFIHKNAEETEKYVQESHDVYKKIIDAGVVTK